MKKIQSAYLFYTLLLVWGMSSQGSAQDHIDTLIKHYAAKAEKYLVKNKSIKNQYQIDKNGIAIFASPSQKNIGNPEILIHWHELSTVQQIFRYTDKKYQLDFYDSKQSNQISRPEAHAIHILANAHLSKEKDYTKPLGKYKVAIDPGHLANNMKTAMAEGRFIDIQMPDGSKAQFFESDLAYATAVLIKDSLEKLGAEVMLTREHENKSASGKSLHDWIKTDLTWLLRRKGLSQASINSITSNVRNGSSYYKYFLQNDLIARAEKINDFAPDAAVILHFNADSKNTGWRYPTHRNYGMVFTQGSFMKGELNSKDDRFHFLRILLSDNLDRSISLSSLIMREFEDQLKVPAVKQGEDEPGYLPYAAIHIQDGVYARNLRLCRMINAPLCYGEPLLQDNLHELEAFNGHDYHQGKVPPRIKTVANAYITGIIKYFNTYK